MTEFFIFVFNVIIGTVLLLVKIILMPIDYIIAQFIPTLSDALTAIGQFLTLIASGLGWAISASGIPYFAIALVATYGIFRLTLPIQMYFVKLAIKWYTTLKP